jgi:hypothetical protein
LGAFFFADWSHAHDPAFCSIKVGLDVADMLKFPVRIIAAGTAITIKIPTMTPKINFTLTSFQETNCERPKY